MSDDTIGTHDDVERDLAELRSLASRRHPDATTWEQPPADLFDRIRNEVRATSEETATTSPAPAPGEHPDALVATVTPLSERRDRRGGGTGVHRGWQLIAAAVVLLILAVGVLVRLRGPGETVVASIDLERLEGSASGSVDLVDVGGTMQLRLATTGLSPEELAAEGYLELWVIDPTVSRLVSLGPLRDDGRYDVPASVDMASFPIVDISIEPPDGDPTHSGRSILRGQLDL